MRAEGDVDYLGYYGYPNYWDGGGLWGAGMVPYAPMPLGDPSASAADAGTRDREIAAEADRHRNDDPHLRSCQAIVGYHIQASDGEIGHVASLLVDEQTWAIRYLVVDTSNWWMGHQVLVAPPWITGVHWEDMTVSVGLSRQAIREAPPYDSTAELNRQQESTLHSHHQRPVYWGSGGA